MFTAFLRGGVEKSDLGFPDPGSQRSEQTNSVDCSPARMEAAISHTIPDILPDRDWSIILGAVSGSLAPTCFSGSGRIL